MSLRIISTEVVEVGNQTKPVLEIHANASLRDTEILLRELVRDGLRPTTDRTARTA